MRERWWMCWKAWTARWLCVTGERSSPARRRHPVRAYSEASTALPRTNRAHVRTSTVWAGAGRRSWQHSTQRWTPAMLTTTAPSESARRLPCNAGSPLHFRRQGGTPFRRRSAGDCRLEGSHGSWASTGTRRRSTWKPSAHPSSAIGSYRRHLLLSPPIPVTFMLAT